MPRTRGPPTDDYKKVLMMTTATHDYLANALTVAATANIAKHAHDIAEGFVRRADTAAPLELQWAGLMSVRDTLPSLLTYAAGEGLHIEYLLHGLLTASEKVLREVMASDVFSDENKALVASDAALVLSFIRDYLDAVEA